MSRYALLTEDDDLEVSVGFDEGFGAFFLTIADVHTCTGEAGSYLFHNMDHHPGVGMTLDEVASTMQRFGLVLPADLAEHLASDARRCGSDHPARREAPRPAEQSTRVSGGRRQSYQTGVVSVLGWQAV